MTGPIPVIAPIPGDWWIGRTVVQYDAQWTWTAIAFDDGTVIVLSVDEVTVGHWFEVFPLKFDRSLPDYLAQHVFKWIALPVPLEIFRASALWREEWQQPAQDHYQFMGAGPHAVQYAAPLQSAPLDVPAFQVEAGIALLGKDGSRLLVCSSDNTPFKIDFATQPAAIEKILRGHTLR
ncbi:MAG: hypothetical protein M3Y65_25730 [Pseudomonadota bacterium]|nr:hypothetical protein [Pseudomonadota bacterium]